MTLGPSRLAVAANCSAPALPPTAAAASASASISLVHRVKNGQKAQTGNRHLFDLGLQLRQTGSGVFLVSRINSPDLQEGLFQFI